MSYQLALTEQAERHLLKWRKSGAKKDIEKILALFEELKEHPMSGTGKVEALRGKYAGYWSRRINKQHRIIYSIRQDIVTVIVISLWGHYDDK